MTTVYQNIPYRRWRRSSYSDRGVLVVSRQGQKVIKHALDAMRAGATVEMETVIVYQKSEAFRPAEGSAYDVLNVRIEA